MFHLRIKTLTSRSFALAGLLFFLIANSYAVNMQFLRYSPVSNFSPEDFELLQTTGLKALNENEDGKTSQWKNPQTEHSGSVTPMESSTIDDMHCRKTKITNQAKDRSGQVIFTFCKVSNRWKILK